MTTPRSTHPTSTNNNNHRSRTPTSTAQGTTPPPPGLRTVPSHQQQQQGGRGGGGGDGRGGEGGGGGGGEGEAVIWIQQQVEHVLERKDAQSRLSLLDQKLSLLETDRDALGSQRSILELRRMRCVQALTDEVEELGQALGELDEELLGMSQFYVPVQGSDSL